MDREEELFLQIVEEMLKVDSNIEAGKMMSAPGIKYKSKNFCFYYNKDMVFRLGKDFDLKSEAITRFSFLNPFKNKPPMKGWFQISYEYADKWLLLAKKAQQQIKKEIG